MSVVRVAGNVQLASGAGDVWPLIVDTDRMNRLMGLEPVRYTAIEEGEGGRTPARFVGETRLNGFTVRYEEAPFEWTYQQEFGVHRRFLQGPLEYLRMGWILSPGRVAEGGFEGGTRLSVTFEAKPRSVLLKPFAWLGGRRAVQGLIGLGEAIDRYVQDKGPSPFVNPVAPSDDEALSLGTERLIARGVTRELAERIASHVRNCPDADALRIRPFELADEWELARRTVLAAMLHAVPAGLVELRWAIVCPSCRTASQEVPRLADISLEGHCQMCDIAFELELDKAVEATFHPHPAVRVVPDQMFCIGGPARTPHVLTQLNLDAHAEKSLVLPAEPGRYRLFSRGGARATVNIAAGEPASSTAHIEAERIVPPELSLGLGGTIELENGTAEARHVKLERLTYASAAATAHVVSTMPEFRSVFSSDLLKRETPLKVARVAILFSDLTGSTALYTSVGDAAAFRLVDDHFDVLRAVIARHQGVVVKTMGDAVMAAFVDETSCARAAVECLERFDAFRKTAKHGELTDLKLGMYGGACYVVTANGALDYFGQTVNVASRLQHLAESGELIVEARVGEDLAKDGRLTLGEPFAARVKGVAEPLSVARVRLKA